MKRGRAGPIGAVSVAAAAALAVAAVGGTVTELGPWYRALSKPAWQPPDWAFGVIWTAIFAFAAAAGATGWRATASTVTREWMLGLFALNGFLNVLWSLLFFRLHRPDWALIEVVGLWLSIGVLMVFLARVSRTASALLAPYIVWVSIAAALNYEVIRLNPPFGGAWP
ncbi:TspO/MBR family protein [Phenylobacterium sp.]|uniref:TspO/MBR family protein n=1 Tax=Phenylobacterium sp. TaxID=1871053 RepID=UPI0026000250|nr:TspO/MBR family protein [Phenylobacterium sp.]